MYFKILCVMWLGLSTIITNGDVTRFKKGDCVCFLGDSITKQGGYHYQIQLFYATRFPNEPLLTWNCGLAGHTAKQMLKRHQWDVMTRNPSVVCIMAGMNDVRRHLYQPGKSGAQIDKQRHDAIVQHLDSMDKLINNLTRKKVRVIVLTPSIYDQTAKLKRTCCFGVNDALKQCAAGVKKISQKYNVEIVDFSKEMEVINLKNQAVDPKFTIVGPDRTHPKGTGHLVMAYLFLKTQGISPVISDIAIDAAKQSIIKQNNCNISKVNFKDGSLQFDCIEKALPFPTDKRNKSALSLVPFSNDLNKEELKISGLGKWDYDVVIDGKRILTASSEKLGKGINLAILENTPQYIQALNVKKLLVRRSGLETKLRILAHVNYLVFADLKNPSPEEKKKILEKERLRLKSKNTNKVWNNYCLKLIDSYDKLVDKKDAIEKEMDELLKKAYSVNKPILHHYEIRMVHKKDR